MTFDIYAILVSVDLHNQTNVMDINLYCKNKHTVITELINKTRSILKANTICIVLCFSTADLLFTFLETFKSFLGEFLHILQLLLPAE